MKPNPRLYGADKLECDMVAAGWVRSPNNIHGLPSVHWDTEDPFRGASPIWYPGASGMPETPEGTETQVTSDRIRVFRNQFFGGPYTKTSFWDQVTVAVFDNVTDFLNYCRQSGRVSEAAAAFSNSWD